MNQFTKAVKSLAAKYNETSLILRIAIGLLIGAALALICPGAVWLEEFGSLFVGALKGIAPVLVFVHRCQRTGTGLVQAGPPLRHRCLAVYADDLCGRGAERVDQQAVPADAGSGRGRHGGRCAAGAG